MSSALLPGLGGEACGGMGKPRAEGRELTVEVYPPACLGSSQEKTARLRAWAPTPMSADLRGPSAHGFPLSCQV